jgi:hypothetical protein
MPRAADYRRAANTLRVYRANAADAAVFHRRRTATEFGGVGPIAETHVATMRSVADELDAAVTELDRLAQLCDRRADVCDEYAREVAAYERLPLLERVFVRPPSRPATWADA